jgi:pentatricopeptide repeat protein
MVEKHCAEKGSLHFLSAIKRPLSIKAYISLLKACSSSKSLHQARQIKTHLAHYSVSLSGLLGDYLVVTLARCGDPDEALLTSHALARRTVFSWTAIISSYSDEGLGLQALEAYRLMLLDGIEPDPYTFVAIVRACGLASDIIGGMLFHSDMISGASNLDVFVISSLISMYGKCGAVLEAEHVFLRCPNRGTNAVCCNAMFSAYLECGYLAKALQLFGKMHDEEEDGLLPHRLSCVILLQACASLAETWSEDENALVEIGRSLHAYARRHGFESDETVCSALVIFYGKCGMIREAENVFLSLSEWTFVSWTAMLSAYLELGQPVKVVQLYHHLAKTNVSWDHVMLTCVLQACSAAGSLEICKRLHFVIVDAGYEALSSVASTLIHAYGNCAEMADGGAVFDGFSEPSIVLWNAYIAGHAGEFLLCSYMFESLRFVGIFPDGVTFNSIISACSHSGCIPEGLGYFESMQEQYGLDPDLKHYGSILDLVGRAGLFEMAECVVNRMPMPADLSVWLCLLGACRAHGNVELARKAFDRAVHLKPEQDTAYIVMSSMHAGAGSSEEDDAT